VRRGSLSLLVLGTLDCIATLRRWLLVGATCVGGVCKVFSVGERGGLKVSISFFGIVGAGETDDSHHTFPPLESRACLQLCAGGCE
jgi:hypothetical protein